MCLLANLTSGRKHGGSLNVKIHRTVKDTRPVTPSERSSLEVLFPKLGRTSSCLAVCSQLMKLAFKGHCDFREQLSHEGPGASTKIKMDEDTQQGLCEPAFLWVALSRGGDCVFYHDSEGRQSRLPELLQT